jgi:TctA family transporter
VTQANGGIRLSHLLQLRELEFELVGTILGILEGCLQSLHSVITLYLLLQIAESALVLFGLCTHVDQIGVGEL